MPENQKQDVFRLPQVVAAIEKLTFTTDQIYNCESQPGVRLNVLSLLELFAFDNVLNFIHNQFSDENLTEHDIPDLKNSFNTPTEQTNVNEFLVREFYTSKPQEKKSRLKSIFTILEKYFKYGDRGFRDIGNYYQGTGSTPTTRRKAFIKEFVGYFYRDIMNMLIDLRVVAELSENKEVSKDYVINIIKGGNNQIVQGNDMDGSSATQNINSTQDQ